MNAQNQVLTIICLLLMGTVGLATAPGLQLRIMKHAGDAPTVASGANIAAFNIGNAVGALLGGIAISQGLGYVSPLWVGAHLAVAAFVVLFLASFRVAPQVKNA